MFPHQLQHLLLSMVFDLLLTLVLQLSLLLAIFALLPTVVIVIRSVPAQCSEPIAQISTMTFPSPLLPMVFDLLLTLVLQRLLLPAIFALLPTIVIVIRSVPAQGSEPMSENKQSAIHTSVYHREFSDRLMCI